MRILINASNLKAGGGLQVADSFLSQLCNFNSHEFLVVLPHQLEYLQPLLESYPNTQFKVYNTPASLQGVIWGYSSFLNNLVAEYNIDLVFTIFGPPLWKPSVPHIVGFARPQLIYPDSPFFTKMNWVKRLKSWAMEHIKLYNFRICSNTIIVETEDVQHRLSKLLIDIPIYTVTNNINQIFLDSKEWSKTVLPAPFSGFTLLCISANHPHKNLKIIPLVIAELRRISPEFSFRFIVTLTEKELPIPEEYKSYVVFLGKIQIRQCPLLYRQANAMFLPTLLECFSASYPEAMYMKCPILTSNLSFAHGLCGDSAIYFDPLNPKDIAEKILYLARNKEVQNSLIAKGAAQLSFFDSFDTRAEKYLQIIEQSLIY